MFMKHLNFLQPMKNKWHFLLESWITLWRVYTVQIYIHVLDIVRLFQTILWATELLKELDFGILAFFQKVKIQDYLLKLFGKLMGKLKYNLYIPINQRSLATNKGLWADFKARLTQAKSVSQDQVEVGYNLYWVINSKMSLLKRLHLFYCTC